MSRKNIAFYNLYFNLSSGISLHAIIIFGSKSESSFHSKNALLSKSSSLESFSNLLSIVFITHNLSKTSYTLATASILLKSVILTICSSLSQEASKV
jgi:ABC-type polysaccharide transport system permease subunit